PAPFPVTKRSLSSSVDHIRPPVLPDTACTGRVLCRPPSPCRMRKSGVPSPSRSATGTTWWWGVSPLSSGLGRASLSQSNSPPSPQRRQDAALHNLPLPQARTHVPRPGPDGVELAQGWLRPLREAVGAEAEQVRQAVAVEVGRGHFLQPGQRVADPTRGRVEH